MAERSGLALLVVAALVTGCAGRDASTPRVAEVQLPPTSEGEAASPGRHPPVRSLPPVVCEEPDYLITCETFPGCVPQSGSTKDRECAGLLYYPLDATDRRALDAACDLRATLQIMEKVAGIEEGLFRAHRPTTPELGAALQRHIDARRAEILAGRALVDGLLHRVDEATLSRLRDVLRQAARQEAASYRQARHICS